MMHSVTSWLKGWSSDGHPPEKPEHLVVSESLLLELQYQINEAEQAARERAQQEKIRQTGVDYSWLITNPSKGFEIPELEKLELEELCMKVKASECGKIINSFRDALLSESAVENFPKIFRTIIIRTIDNRPKDDTMSEWMMKSLSKLRKPSGKIAPVDFDPDQRTTASSEATNMADDNSHGLTRVEDLPV